ncbi:MAG TPA: SDR family NAD(P)-dependent oxidoreductase, partial [Opitutaceae bacterium]
MAANDTSDALRRKLAAAVELCARGSAQGRAALIGQGAAGFAARLPVGQWTWESIATGETGRAWSAPATLIAATDLPADDATIARMAAWFAVGAGPQAMLLLEIPSGARERWRRELEAAGFGELRMSSSSSVAAPAYELLMARFSGSRASSTPKTAPAAPAGVPPAVLAQVCATLEKLLRLSPGDLDPASPFSEYGVDSMAGVAFVNELNRTLGLDLKPMVLFDYTSATKLAGFIAGQCAPVLPAVAKPVVPALPIPSQSMPVPALVPAARAADAASHTARAGDIAVIGLAGRFPGAANIDDYWRNLRAGVSSITEVPPERWDHGKVYDPAAKRPDRTSFKWGGFVPDADKFDPLFFAISGREAEATDPQQRLFLEECYHALEDAGYAGLSARKARKCGVFVGVEPGDYMGLFTSSASVGDKAPLFQGNAESILAARISYFLDLKGPSLAINTACSSSLVAIHLACQSLAHGECDLALAGGVRVFATEKVYLALGNMGMLAADGRCKTFDAAADGFVPGEAVGVLVLKPLAAALRDGDTIHGVIKGSAINQDGRTNGITAPSSLAQTEVQREACERAGVSPATFDYVEAHGTGTKLGDPIEVQALTNTFRHYTPDIGFCALGAVKTNIGHTMAAAGVCGVIKVLLALRHGEIPPSLNLAQENPYIDFATSPFRPVAEPQPWAARSGRPRRAAVSSFGFSGTNSHAVIEEAPAVVRQASASGAQTAQMVVLSARTKESLRELLLRLTAGLAPEMTLTDVAFTLAVGRGHFEERVGLVVESVTELREKLARLARGETPPQTWRGTVVIGKLDASDATIFPKVAELAVRELASAVSQTADGEAARREQLGVLAALFAKGAELPWEKIFGGFGRRISLPGYPFARERYWVSALVQPKPAAAGREILTGEEFFLRGHVVDGKPTLPGVMYLELARRAWAARQGEGSAVVLSNVAWKRPLTVEHATEPAVSFDAATDVFSISVAGTVHAEGRIRRRETAPLRAEEIAAIRARCLRQGDVGKIYAQCRAAGLALGEGMRSIVDIRFSDTEALARLEVDPGEAARFGWHPGLLDGALQTTAALGDGAGGGLPVPFAVGEMWAGKLPPRCWAHVRREPARGGLLQFTISLLDDRGAVLGRFERMAMRALVPERGAPAEAVWFKPAWRDSAVDWSAGRTLTGALLAVGGGEAWVEALQAGADGLEVTGSAFSRSVDWDRRLREVKPNFVVVKWPAGVDLGEGAAVVVDFCRALMREAGDRQVEMLLVHAPGEALAAASAGLGRTLRLEKTTLHFRAVELAGDEAGAVLAELARGERMARVRIAGARREVETVEVVTLPPAKTQDAAWREGGVYLLTGGAGGLGARIAVDLARRHRAKLVLAGRSPASGKTDALLKEIAALGGEARYVQADVSEPEQVAQAVAEARRVFGPLNGVLHAAGAIEDGFLRDKDAASALRVMGPKVLGAVALDAATREEPLDFFALFSSVAGVLGNVGQADYGWANSFLDEFAEVREAQRLRGECHGVTVSIAWPLWREGGMQQGGEMERLKLQRAGLQALETAQGLALLDQALAAGEPRLAVLVGRGEAIRAMLQAPEAKRAVAREAAPSPTAAVTARGDDLQAWLTARFAELVKLPAARIQPADALEKYGIDSVMVMDFTQRLETEFGELSKTLLFEHQTLAELADYFARQHPDVV